MTGPEHFREAEMMLALVEDGAADWQPLAAAALVHATLAHAAAVIAGAAHRIRPADQHEWLKAIDPEYATEVTR